MKNQITRRQFAAGTGLAAMAAAAGTAGVSTLFSRLAPSGTLYADAATSRHIETAPARTGWKSASTGNVFGKPGFGTLPG
ncbi:MAG: hypothetical protein R3D32_10155 [Nitratireductor sp.]